MKWVLDLDDTLYLERDFVASGFRAVEATTGIPGLSETAWELFEEGVRGNTFDRALDRLGVDGDVPRMVQIYRDHHPSIALQPDALRFLARVDRLCLISDGLSGTQQNKLHALGIAARFESTILTGRWGPGYSKPHPRAFLETERRLGRGPYVYVGDNPAKDFEAPRRLGWKTIRVRRKKGLYAAVRGIEADWTVETLDEVERLLA